MQRKGTRWSVSKWIIFSIFLWWITHLTDFVLDGHNLTYDVLRQITDHLALIVWNILWWDTHLSIIILNTLNLKFGGITQVTNCDALNLWNFRLWITHTSNLLNQIRCSLLSPILWGSLSSSHLVESLNSLSLLFLICGILGCGHSFSHRIGESMY
jgi:hypothetical protein